MLFFKIKNNTIRHIYIQTFLNAQMHAVLSPYRQKTDTCCTFYCFFFFHFFKGTKPEARRVFFYKLFLRVFILFYYLLCDMFNSQCVALLPDYWSLFLSLLLRKYMLFLHRYLFPCNVSKHKTYSFGPDSSLAYIWPT